MIERDRILELLHSDKTPDEQLLCGAALRAILAGEAMDSGRLSAVTGLNRERVDSLLEGLTRRGLMVVEERSGRVVGSWGLTAAPTVHRLQMRERELYTWCAADAIGIPAALSENALVASSCHHCGRPLHIRIVDGRIGSSRPPDVRIWVAPSQEGHSVVRYT
jgi:alkylmercury lyase